MFICCMFLSIYSVVWYLISACNNTMIIFLTFVTLCSWLIFSYLTTLHLITVMSKPCIANWTSFNNSTLITADVMYLPYLFLLIQTDACTSLTLLYILISACNFCIFSWNDLYNISYAMILYHISFLYIVLIASTFYNACLYASNCSAVNSAVVININIFLEIDFDTVAILTNSDV